jgi:hypothetical protein
MTKEFQKTASPLPKRSVEVPRRSAVLAALSLLGASLGTGLQSSAVAGDKTQIAPDAQKQRMERWKIMQDTQTKSVAPKGGSTGPTAPPKPTQGNVHR